MAPIIVSPIESNHFELKSDMVPELKSFEMKPRLWPSKLALQSMIKKPVLKN